MTFSLSNAGHRCYSLLYEGEHVGAVFTIDDHTQAKPWVAMLHDGWARRGRRPPAPFTDLEHRFGSLDEVVGWLGARSAGRRAEQQAPWLVD
jgi:hypothetical protein